MRLFAGLAVPVAAMLGACASYTPPPANAPSATLTVRNVSAQLDAAVNTYKDPAACDGFVPIRTGHGTSYEKNRLKPGDSIEVRVASGKLFGLYASSERAGEHHSVSYGCSVSGFFEPRQGQSYLAEFRYEGNTCSMKVSRRVGAQLLPVEDLKYRRQGRTSLSRPSMHCTD
jgi:hypothetical protein